MEQTTTLYVSEEALQKGAAEGMDAFLQVFVDQYKSAVQNKLDAQSMAALNSSQHTLLAYWLFREEVMEGGFVQLIQNGYGPYIFENPFAKSLKLFGLNELAKLIYKAHNVYEAHKADLTRERTDEEFMAMYEQYEAFDELEEAFIEQEEELTARLAAYVDAHVEEFAKIVKSHPVA